MGVYRAIVLLMIFAHIVDDFYLQTISSMSNLKQRDWWMIKAPKELYKYDYIMVLIVHSFSWSFMVHLPIMIYGFVTKDYWMYFPMSLNINLIIHFLVDHLKANKKKINLVQDQIIHLIQIILTGFIWYFCTA